MPKSPIKRRLDEAQWLTETLPIRLYGDPILTTPCEPVTNTEIKSGQAQKWADQLISFLQTYREKTGVGRGLAANQIGISKQIILVLLDSGPEIYINPKVTSSEGAGSYPEACISAASLVVGDVIRPWTAKISYTTLDGTAQSISPDNLQTRVLLHEIDHLKGMLCSDKYEPGTIRLATGDPDEILKATLKRIS
jgi:peptide deformylase